MTCSSGKTCHQTKQQAMKQIRSSQRRGAPELRVYKCPLCEWFHVTSSINHRVFKPLHK